MKIQEEEDVDRDWHARINKKRFEEWDISKELSLDMSAWKMTIYVPEPWFRS
jgi:hypothetical protein